MPLSETHPRLAAQWNHSKNASLRHSQLVSVPLAWRGKPISPDTVSWVNDVSVWWACPDEHGLHEDRGSTAEWLAPVDARVNGQKGCPACSRVRGMADQFIRGKCVGSDLGFLKFCPIQRTADNEHDREVRVQEETVYELAVTARGLVAEMGANAAFLKQEAVDKVGESAGLVKSRLAVTNAGARILLLKRGCEDEQARFASQVNALRDPARKKTREAGSAAELFEVEQAALELKESIDMKVARIDALRTEQMGCRSRLVGIDAETSVLREENDELGDRHAALLAANMDLSNRRDDALFSRTEQHDAIKQHLTEWLAWKDTEDAEAGLRPAMQLAMPQRLDPKGKAGMLHWNETVQSAQQPLSAKPPQSSLSHHHHRQRITRPPGDDENAAASAAAAACGVEAGASASSSVDQELEDRFIHALSAW